MAKNPILGIYYLNIYIFLFVSILNFFHCFGSNSFTTSFSYSKTEIKPYGWRYIRVNLPPWFSSMSISLESDVGLGLQRIKNFNASNLPIICLREGSPPLPDSSNNSSTVLNSNLNEFLGDINALRTGELCYPMRKNISLQFTNEQILPGVWYWALFNGIGPTRTQSKMINRGTSFSFSGNISVEGCATPALSGPYCNQTIDMLLCNNVDSTTKNNISNILSCQNADGYSCHENTDPRIYSLDLLQITELLTISATNVTGNGSGIMLTSYARYGAIPVPNLYDYSSNISDYPLVIRLPKVGSWYFAVYTNSLSIGKVCYSFNLQLQQCPEGKAGLNCTWERYALQLKLNECNFIYEAQHFSLAAKNVAKKTPWYIHIYFCNYLPLDISSSFCTCVTILRKNPSSAFESYYLPTTKTALSSSANFLLEPLLSNSTYGVNTEFAWTYFTFDIPYDATGANLHIRLSSDSKINYGLFVKYAGLPNFDSWDYYYANTSSHSNESMSFKLYDSSDELVSFYVLYARGGTWSVGISHLNVSGGSWKGQTAMSISLERCPKRCYSPHGSCQLSMDASGLSIYSYCACDRNHGGFDCSIEIVSHTGHMWQSIFLIASNAAAILPACWSLRHKAFAEWVLFMSSGISSAIYHACDTGTWCALNYRVLQFMDFWLSFMAVVSTFVYLADISEVSKRTIHTVVAIVTALLAEMGPTRSTNIGVVIAIGVAGLLIGWLIEFCTRYRSLSLHVPVVSLNITERWRAAKEWTRNSIKFLVKRFRWWFLLVAFVALAMAAISWTMESNKDYWIWHSLWHISIYTSSFLFLCSKAKTVIICDDSTILHGNYELTRQDSTSRNQ